LEELSYKILALLEKQPMHFLALKRELGLNDQKLSTLLKELRDLNKFVDRTNPDVSWGKMGGKKNPLKITPAGIAALRDHEALKRYEGALENVKRRFEGLWTRAAEREADGMYALFTSLIVDIIYTLSEAAKEKSLSEAERYVKAELAGRLSDIILGYARMCYTRKDLDLGELPLLGYVHDLFVSYRDRDLSDWIEKYAAVDWKEYVYLVPDVDLVDILMTSETDSIAAEKLRELVAGRAAYKHTIGSFMWGMNAAV
jgi:hypothetical protein